jgi:addiction module HigA family antidote
MPDATVSTEQQALAELARSHRWRLVVLFGSTARAGELLCESAADIGLQVLKRRGVGLAGSYREVKLGVAASTLDRLLTGASGISPEMALRLAKNLGRSPESWLAMQYSYDLWQARQRVDLSGVTA